jgi:outer membrane immunogenic protein
MHKFAFVAGALAFVGVCGVAQADGNRAGPFYASPGYNWSGVYFGAHIGGGWGDVDALESLSISFGGTPLLSGSQSHDTSGWLGGVQLGAMKQFGSFVVGTEFSFSGADISGSGGNCFGITTATTGFIDANCHTNINWLLTGLAKAGFARDRWMAYGALGYAVAGVDHSVTVSSPFLPGLQASWSQQDTAYGVAYGAGFDFALGKDFTLGVQYLHANLESRGEGLFLGGVISNGRRDIDLDTITARFSYKWGGDCCAPVPMKVTRGL